MVSSILYKWLNALPFAVKEGVGWVWKRAWGWCGLMLVEAEGEGESESEGESEGQCEWRAYN